MGPPLRLYNVISRDFLASLDNRCLFSGFLSLKKNSFFGSKSGCKNTTIKTEKPHTMALLYEANCFNINELLFEQFVYNNLMWKLIFTVFVVLKYQPEAFFAKQRLEGFP